MYFKKARISFKNTKLLLLAALAVLLLALSISGCTVNNTPAPHNSKEQPALNENTHDKQPDINLVLYFVQFDQDDTYMIREIHRVPYTENVAAAALQELIDDEKSIFPPGTAVLDIKIENCLATVNFNQKVLEASNVGAIGEELGIQSIVNTLTEFPNVEKVAFAVEGKTTGRVLDWWGHVGLGGQPFKRSLSQVYKPAIWVTHPTPNQVVGVPLLIKGSAMVFEGTVQARLLDDSGNLLAEQFTTATAGAPQRGDFEMSIKFDPPAQGHGIVEVFSTSAKDGSVQNKVTIPVQWP